MTNQKVLAEVLSLTRIYARHGRFDLARKLLRELIEGQLRAPEPDNHSLAVAYYNLGEVYSDQGNYLVASDLQKQSVEYWDLAHSKDPGSLLYYANALSEIDQETDKLIHQVNEGEERNIA